MKASTFSFTFFRSHSSIEAKSKRDKSSIRARSIKTVESVHEIRDIMTSALSLSSTAASMADDENSIPAESYSLVTDDISKVKESTKSSVKSNKSGIPGGKLFKGKKSKKQKNKKKSNSNSGSGKSTPMSLRGKIQPSDKPKSSDKQQQPQQQPQQQQIEIVPPSPSKRRVEDVLPDLVPPRNGRQPSRRSTEAEKSAAVIEHVVEMDKHFCCFTCLKYFANFHQVKLECLGD